MFHPEAKDLVLYPPHKSVIGLRLPGGKKMMGSQAPLVLHKSRMALVQGHNLLSVAGSAPQSMQNLGEGCTELMKDLDA